MKNIKRTSTNILRLELQDIYDKLDKLIKGYNELKTKIMIIESSFNVNIKKGE